MEQLDEIVAGLEAIAEQLDEISFEMLREAVSDGAANRPPADKKLTQARRAVEKAAYLLGQIER